MPELKSGSKQKSEVAELSYAYNVTVSGGFSGGNRKDASGEVSVKDNKGVFSIKATDEKTGKSVSLTAEVKEGLDGKYHVFATDGKQKIEVKDVDDLVKSYRENGAKNPDLMAMRDPQILGSILIQSLYKQKYQGDEFKSSTMDGLSVSVSFDQK